ncbi:MAG: hypothetical protein K2I72_01730 [Bacilli bacterium]|nr:hypothetical protein [Bacilli bacterium]
MQIKSLLVEEKEYVMGEIESFLCRLGISYVKVENEIHCPNLILRFYEFNEIKPVILDLLGIIDSWNPLKNINKETIWDCLLVTGEELPFSVGLHNRDFFLKAFTEPQRVEFIPMFPKKATPSPYPQPTNKRKQLQMENQKYMRKLK